jgi:cytochrome oxidase Cu insertion factor (SCO1/SenC/PrrC family)
LASLALLSGALVLTAPAVAAPEIGKPAPDFTATDSNGKTVKLSDQRGKIVVLEWTNHDCPFVKKHYGSGNMQDL